MSKYSINGATLDSIAAPIMSMRGLTGGLTPEEMGTNANAVLKNVTDALNAIAAKGVNITGMTSDNLAALIGLISGTEGGDVGGLTKYTAMKATPTSNVIFTFTNPLGGLAKKISVRCPDGSTTESERGLVQLYTADASVGLGCMKVLNTSTGNVSVYGVRQTAAASSNSQFAISDGKVTLRSYNATTAMWDVECEYEIEIWQ